MSDLSEALSFIKVKSIALEIQNKELTKKCFDLIVRNTVLTNDNIELKKKYEASKELNKRLLETNMDITNKLIKL